MKKLINSPDAVLQDALHGVEAAHGDRVRVIYEPAVIVRIDAPVKGKVGLDLRGRLGSRADARGLRRAWNARRCLPGGGVHLPHA